MGIISPDQGNFITNPRLATRFCAAALDPYKSQHRNLALLKRNSNTSLNLTVIVLGSIG